MRKGDMEMVTKDTKETSFICEAVKILSSLGCAEYSEEKIELEMKELGYKKGYRGTWIVPDDIVLDEEFRA